VIITHYEKLLQSYVKQQINGCIVDFIENFKLIIIVLQTTLQGDKTLGNCDNNESFFRQHASCENSVETFNDNDDAF